VSQEATEEEIQALELIGRIYDATAGLIHWQRVVEDIATALDDASTVLWVKQPGGGRAHRFVAGAGPELATARSDRFIEAATASGSTPSRFETGFATPAAGWDEPALGHFSATQAGAPAIAWLVFRGEGETDFTPVEKRLLEALVPHLARIFEMTRNFLSVTRERIALAEVMDRVPAGMLLLDENGRVVFRNHSADRILARNDGLGLVDGMLHAENADADATLHRFIAEVVASPPGSAAGGATVVPRSDAPVPYPVSVSRLLPGETVRFAVAAAIVNDPDSGSEPAAELMRSLHGLTGAEAELVELLARGYSMEEAAGRRGVSIHTARSQLKQVFQKTGTSRQGELIQLVLRCFVPMVGE
jgi:DNA-binding CsgD family transcriptional regulator/PAS domain-containing protein